MLSGACLIVLLFVTLGATGRASDFDDADVAKLEHYLRVSVVELQNDYFLLP